MALAIAAQQAPDLEPAAPGPVGPRAIQPALNRPQAVVPVVNTPDQIAALVAFARKAWGTVEAEAVAEACTDYHAQDVDVAVRLAKSKGAGWRYAASCLAQWWGQTGGHPKHTGQSAAPADGGSVAQREAVAKYREQRVREIVAQREAGEIERATIATARAAWDRMDPAQRATVESQVRADGVPERFANLFLESCLKKILILSQNPDSGIDFRGLVG